MPRVQAPESQTYRVFLSLTTEDGGRGVALGGKLFIIAQGIAIMGYALTKEMEARGHRVNGVFVSTS